MPGSLTDTGEALSLNYLCGNADPVDPTGLELALTSDAPSDSATGTEVTVAYQAVTIGAASGTSPAAASNTGLVAFPDMPAVGSPGVVGWNLYDASGRRIWHGTFDEAKIVNAGDTFEVPVGALDLTQD